jgi:DNA-binding IclR family transcriptional regulator
MAQTNHPVRTVDRTLEILEIIRELDGAGVSEIADRVQVGKSAVHNHLNTLAQREYVVKEGDEYHIGLAFSASARTLATGTRFTTPPGRRSTNSPRRPASS